jgi:hypothetical protein
VAGVTDRAKENADFVASPLGMLIMILAYASVTGAFGFILVIASDWIMRVVGIAGLLFFAVFTLAWVRNSALRGIVVSINSEGLLDRRLSDKRIPWSAVQRATVYEGSPQAYSSLWIYLDSKFDATWPKHFDAKLISWIGQFFGCPGTYWVPAIGLNARHEDLADVVIKHKFFRRW